MSEIYELTAENRTEIGKGGSRRLRRLENKVPAVVYGGEKSPEMITIDHNALANALENEGFYSHVLTLTIAGKKEKVVLKDLHRHPSRPKILHADFLRINPKTKLVMQVPLHFKGDDKAPGVKEQGGVVSHLLSEIEIRCLPGDLPEFIEVDLSNLKLGDIVHLSDLKLPKGIEISALLQGKEHDQPVASIHKATVSQEASVNVLAESSEESAKKPEGESEA
jgi:large subunit ribosomal protein L25